ncbi:unnamed protein product [Absidia cylindrospora]
MHLLVSPISSMGRARTTSSGHGLEFLIVDHIDQNELQHKQKQPDLDRNSHSDTDSTTGNSNSNSNNNNSNKQQPFQSHLPRIQFDFGPESQITLYYDKEDKKQSKLPFYMAGMAIKNMPWVTMN